jgi:hypothetical protein
MSSKPRRVALCAASIAALGLSVSACGASFSIGETLNNPDKVLAGLLNPTPKSVTCPDNISAKAGTKFSCKVVASDGGPGRLGVLEDTRGHIVIKTIDGHPVHAGTGTGTGTAGSAAGSDTGTATQAGTTTG